MNKKVFAAIGVPVAIVFFASLFASSHPDALERISINYGFEDKAKETSSFFTDYSLSFINNEFLSAFFAGVIGLVLLYGLYKLISIAAQRFAK
ncbi:PDGLE domain-containing protein [Endomicrobium proavitum]|uniref:CbiM-like Co2+ ABC transporter permease component n=1 Tax=Endomicrobium proavitum TaxID=1408281 RepID=A0A0G3WIT4_9BACT|nr:PDGLE domain-containing protein [Endomicrobium proavitum]AKL98556.1 CbiM-like Co2+ ABC transporter permease component [Endomicrobium proavitum]